MRVIYSLFLLLAVGLACSCRQSSQDAEAIYKEGWSLFRSDDLNGGAELLLQSLALQNEKNPTPLLAKTYHAISYVYWEQDFCQKSLDYALKGLACAEELKNDTLVRLLTNRVASSYYLSHKKDSAMVYYNKMLILALQHSDSVQICRAYNNMGAVRISQSRPEEALRLFQQSQFYVDDEKDQFTFHYNCSRCYQNMLQWEDCAREIRLCLEIGKKDLEAQEKLYRRLYICLKNLGQYEESCIYADSSYLLTDSIFSVKQREELKEITEKYQQEKYEAEIKLLRTHWVLALVNVIFVAMILFVVVMYRNKKRVVGLQQKMENLRLQISRGMESDADIPIEDLSELYRQQLVVARDLFRSRPVAAKLDQLKYHTDKNYLSDEERLPLIDGVTEVFIDSLQNLRTTFPELTADECLYAILCFVGCNNAVISILTKTTEATLRKRRSRFKQKTHEDVINLLLGQS